MRIKPNGDGTVTASQVHNGFKSVTQSHSLILRKGFMTPICGAELSGLAGMICKTWSMQHDGIYRKVAGNGC